MIKRIHIGEISPEDSKRVLIAISKKTIKNGDCIEWTGKRSSAGYGIINVNGKRMRIARVLFSIKLGSFDSSLDVLHKCDNPPCINIDHLFLGCHQDNMKDRSEKNRQIFGSNIHNSVLDECLILKIIDMWQSGVSAKKIGEYFGVTRSAIQLILRGKTWKHVPRDKIGPLDGQEIKKRAYRGTMCHKCKLTPCDVLSIRSRRSDGESLLSLAIAFGVSKSNIKCICEMRSWKHL